jgi:hypothetical protein
MSEHIEIIQDLGGGLTLRRSTPADVEKLADLHARIHAENDAHYEEGLAWYVRDMCNGNHPTFGPGDFTMVEESATGRLVSSLCLIDQTWSYEGIPFQVGRPELVSTIEEYRNRGLVRRQFDLIHEWSRQRGQLVQAITGIPYYYRLFGYEQSMDTEAGWNLYEYQIPRLKENETEAFTIRDAVEADIPLIMRLYARSCTRSEVYCERDRHYWEHTLRRISPGNCEKECIGIVENTQHEAIGMVIYGNEFWGPTYVVPLVEILPGHPWMQPCQAILRFVWRKGLELAPRLHADFHVLGLWLGREHPAYQALPGRLPKEHPPYGMYMRVPDLPAFLDHIHPVLEKRLASSPASGYTGELLVSFYKSALKFTFEKGRLLPVEAVRAVNPDAPAAFPDLTFLQLVFGGKSLAELEACFPDCTISACSDARPLLNALFPKKPSNTLAI